MTKKVGYTNLWPKELRIRIITHTHVYNLLD